LSKALSSWNSTASADSKIRGIELERELKLIDLASMIRDGTHRCRATSASSAPVWPSNWISSV
jgi:hypothetical protein